MNLKALIRDVYDFPKEGIVFKDITTVLKDPKGLKEAINAMEASLKALDFDYVVGPESRGFIFGVPIAYNLGKGFIPVRKKGKLPYKTKSCSYDLEYGTATIEIHEDAILPGDKVVIVDDLLATGGTSEAIVQLIETMGGEVVQLSYLIELEFLEGRKKLENQKVESIIQY